MIYLDNSATTKPNPACVDAMTKVLTETWGNPSSVHAMGMEAEGLLHRAREQVAKALGAEKERIFFTSGGTEADNWAIFAAARRLGKRGKHIVTTAQEHHAVLSAMEHLESQGFEVTYLAPDKDGFVSAKALEEALRPDTILVSVMMVNNETGAVMPISDMVKVTRRKSPLALFHTDAVQGFLKIPFKAKTLGADLISISAHKVHGPKGVGALYIRPNLPLPAYLMGGGQEQNFRSGTENLPGIVGFGAAVANTDAAEDIRRMTAARDAYRNLLEQEAGVEILGKGDAPHILSISVPGLRSQGLINCLQDKGFFVSAGSACSKGHRSHVLTAMNLDAKIIDGAVRLSFCADTPAESAKDFVLALREARRSLKG